MPEMITLIPGKIFQNQDWQIFANVTRSHTSLLTINSSRRPGAADVDFLPAFRSSPTNVRSSSESADDTIACDWKEMELRHQAGNKPV